MNRFVGLALIIGGICVVFVGLLFYSGWLSWFGRLPGDIRYESDNLQVYVPIVSMLSLGGAECAVLFAAPLFLSFHQSISFIAFQTEFARGLL